MKRIKEKFVLIPDVRPLDQREEKNNTRKGMIKSILIPSGMTGKQLQLYKQFEFSPAVPPAVHQDNDIEPEYVKKMKRAAR